MLSKKGMIWSVLFVSVMGLSCAGALCRADPPESKEGATVILDGLCLLSSRDSGLRLNLASHDMVVVRTPSGNVLLTCKFVIPNGREPGQTIIRRGFRCWVSRSQSTTQSQVVSTPGGQAILHCRYTSR